MHARRWAGTLVLALGLWGSLAQAQSVQMGTLTGALPPDATVGALRGPVSADTGVGAFAGSFPASTAVGGLRGLSGPAGAFSGTLGPNAPLGGLQGSIPPAATSGALASPAPPNAFFGPPTPADTARRNEALGEVHLIDRSNGSADAALDRATGIRQQTLGPTHPGVVEGLENQARLLEQYNRDDKAAELQDRATKIRKEAERPVRLR